MRAPVSVVIPCYRCASTIQRSVESVTQQTLVPKEIFLVDDYSNDDGQTLGALYRLQNELDGIIEVNVIAMDINQGPGIARNAGWDAATQPWIAFLDSDDTWHPQKVEIQLSWLEQKGNVALCAHSTSLFSHAPTADEFSASKAAVKIPATQLLFRNSFPTRSVMLKRDLPFRFTNKRRAEDYQLWLDIAFSNYPCWRLPAVLAYSFRPEFSPGGLSGNLWAHEKDELTCFLSLYRERKIFLTLYLAASLFSLIKFCRRYAMIRFNWASMVTK